MQTELSLLPGKEGLVNPSATYYPFCPKVHHTLLYCHGFLMNYYRDTPYNSAFSRYVTPENTLSHCWFILTTRSPPLTNTCQVFTIFILYTYYCDFERVSGWEEREVSHSFPSNWQNVMTKCHDKRFY